MHPSRSRKRGRRLVAVLVVVMGVAAPAFTADGAVSGGASGAPFPLDERLFFDIRYLGVHCGTMTIESFSEESDQGPIHRIVLTAKSSKFFDGIYKVRTRIDSWFSGRRMSSIRYQVHGQEKKKIKDERYEIDFERREVIRDKNGEVSTIVISNDQVHDPLAYLYRLRALVSEPGEAVSLVLVTSKGDVPTVADVVERKPIRTAFGTREALRVIPRPEDAMLFSKRGHMEVWIGADEARLPYRVIFDLSFGKLVAKLKEKHPRPRGGELSASGS